MGRRGKAIRFLLILFMTTSILMQGISPVLAKTQTNKQTSASESYTPPKGYEKAVYQSGLELSKMTGTEYTTTKEEYIETTRFVLYLDDGVKVPVNVIELINHLMDMIEEETGYQFYVPVKDEYSTGMSADIVRYFETGDDLKKVNEGSDRVDILVVNDPEVGGGYAFGHYGIVLEADYIDLLGGEGYALIHELLHVLDMRNGGYMGHVVGEGFTTYYTASIIAKDTILEYNHDSYQELANYPYIIKKTTMEEHFLAMEAGASNYQLGFRLLHFMIEKYGENAYRRIHEKVTNLKVDGSTPSQKEIANALKSELSKNFFTEFVDWYVNNYQRFGDSDKSVLGDWLIENGYLKMYYGNAANVVIPNSVTSIGEAFNANKNLISVEIPDTVTTIGGGAFINCTRLSKVTMADSVTWIAVNAFDSCTSLKNITLSKNLSKIGVNAFWGCTSLEEIIIPESMTKLENNVFTNCTALKKVSLPSKLEEIGNMQFYNCTSLESITLPDSVIKLGTGAFEDCKALNKAVLSKNLKILEDSIFRGCTSLKKIALPKGLTRINESAFNFAGLTSITLPNTVKVIENYAFSNCKSLTKIVIPKSVTSIGKETFYGSPKVVICGYQGSYAEKYAKKYGLKFKKI